MYTFVSYFLITVGAISFLAALLRY